MAKRSYIKLNGGMNSTDFHTFLKRHNRALNFTAIELNLVSAYLDTVRTIEAQEIINALMPEKPAKSNKKPDLNEQEDNCN